MTLRVLVPLLALLPLHSLASEGLVLFTLTQPQAKPLKAELLRAGIERETRGAVEDVTVIHNGLAQGLPADFDRSAPRGWPEVLRADYDAGHSACRERTAGEKGPNAVMAAQACGEKLETALLTRYLQHRKAAAYVSISVQAEKGGRYSAYVSTVRPADTTRFTTELTGIAADALLSSVQRAVADTLEGKGKPSGAKLDPELPTAASDSVRSIAAAQTDLAAVAGACAAVPARISLDSRSPLAQTVQARWNTSAAAGRAAGAPAKCTLKATEEKQDTMMGPTEALDAVLECDGQHHRAMVALGVMLGARSAADVVSERLIKNAFKNLCGK